jgi:cytidyltransferase-like protein
MRIAVYAGTFDPITRGHLSVIERAAGLFDRLYVLVAVNPDKRPLFSVEERVAMIRAATLDWPNAESASTGGMVVDFARNRGAGYLIRGVRARNRNGVRARARGSLRGELEQAQGAVPPGNRRLGLLPPQIVARLRERLEKRHAAAH